MNNTEPKYIKIKNKIKEDIKQGILKDKIPGERVLAKDFQVSYITVRKAITELVEEGILHKFTTKGTFVSNNKISPKVTKNIGFFLDEGIREGISSPYYSLVFKALEKTVKKHGYNLLLFSKSIFSFFCSAASMSNYGAKQPLDFSTYKVFQPIQPIELASVNNFQNALPRPC